MALSPAADDRHDRFANGLLPITDVIEQHVPVRLPHPSADVRRLA